MILRFLEVINNPLIFENRICDVLYKYKKIDNKVSVTICLIIIVSLNRISVSCPNFEFIRKLKPSSNKSGDSNNTNRPNSNINLDKYQNSIYKSGQLIDPEKQVIDEIRTLLDANHQLLENHLTIVSDCLSPDKGFLVSLINYYKDINSPDPNSKGIMQESKIMIEPIIVGIIYPKFNQLFYKNNYKSCTFAKSSRNNGILPKVSVPKQLIPHQKSEYNKGTGMNAHLQAYASVIEKYYKLFVKIFALRNVGDKINENSNEDDQTGITRHNIDRDYLHLKGADLFS